MSWRTRRSKQKREKNQIFLLQWFILVAAYFSSLMNISMRYQVSFCSGFIWQCSSCDFFIRLRTAVKLLKIAGYRVGLFYRLQQRFERPRIVIVLKSEIQFRNMQHNKYQLEGIFHLQGVFYIHSFVKSALQISDKSKKNLAKVISKEICHQPCGNCCLCQNKC